MANDDARSEPRPGGLRIVEGTDERPEIAITEELSDVADRASEALASDVEIFQRGGMLVHVITPTATSPGTKPNPAIRELPFATLRVRMSQIARWVKLDGRKKGYRRCKVPDTIVSAVHVRGQWSLVRPLVGVITAPTIRHDGSVLQLPGYDEHTALLHWPSRDFIEVSEKPTREDAIAAAESILDLVVDFPFERESDRSAWLAGVLTLVGRHAIDGPCPLFAVDANTRGSGKSRLVDVANMLAYGTKAARSSLSGTDEEQRKQITSLLAEGVPSALIDNVKGGKQLGSPAFDALLTSDVWKDRNLGKIQNLTLPARVVWWASGNNLRFAGDLTRRTLRIRLESPLENPEDRKGFKHGEGDALLRHVDRERWKLVTQALIILRAHALADRPTCGATWGSYEAWSRIIASAIRWIGLPDPLESRATEDETADEDRLFTAAVISAIADFGQPVTARELIVELYPHGYYDGERPPDAHPSYAGAREGLEAATNAKGIPPAQQVGLFLKKALGRVINGRSLVCELDPHSKIQRWTVRKSRPSEESTR